MNFDGKALTVVVVDDGSAFGATSRTMTADAREGHDLIIENLTEFSSGAPFAGICISDCRGSVSRS
jgi:hypothetical protein